MKTIVSIDEDYGIGRNGDLLVHNKEDIKFFKETTIGNTVIMGRKTFLSLPNGPLKDRKNIVLTRGNIDCDGIIICHDYLDLIHLKDAFVIGGGEIYNLFLPYYDEIYITKNKGKYNADTFFPRFNEDKFKKEILLERDNFSILKYVRLLQ